MSTPIKINEDYRTPRGDIRAMLNGALRRRTPVLAFILGCLGCILIVGYGAYELLLYIRV